MNIVILDQKTITRDDLRWEDLERLGNVIAYDESTYEEACERIRVADAAVFSSKVRIDGPMMDQAPGLKFIGVLATGFDNVDVEAARERGIACTNIPAYSTESVAQHTIALILEIACHVGMHNASVHQGDWSRAEDFCYVMEPLVLLAGRSLGIIGYGNIGKQVARIGEALGMKILIYSIDGDEALKADFVTLHMPANEETCDFINKERISKMKDGVCLINTARGALVDEEALLEALDEGKIAWYAADVLRSEPPAEDAPLTRHPRAIITPHNCWCPLEIRQRICERAAENLKSFLEGGRKNRID